MHVFSVHTTRTTGVGAIEVIYSDEPAAKKYALGRSGDVGIDAAVVTRFEVNMLGTRKLRAWFVRGNEKSLADRGTPLPRFEPGTDPHGMPTVP